MPNQIQSGSSARVGRVCQDDEALDHRAKERKEAFNVVYITMSDITLHSFTNIPDLDSIELMWRNVKTLISREHFCTLEELYIKVQAASPVCHREISLDVTADASPSRFPWHRCCQLRCLPLTEDGDTKSVLHFISPFQKEGKMGNG
jgi:hypothetical protein